MSWQLGSTLIVAAAVVAGLGWYELRRPPAKLVALVAALAALAVAGRVLFAAIPNVQATTDVALLSGYALGPAPGSWSARSPGSPRTCSWGRAHGHPGRCSAGARRAYSARASRPSPGGGSRASPWRSPVRWPASCSEPGWTSSRWSRSRAARPRDTSRSRRSRCPSTSPTRSATSSSAWFSARRSCACSSASGCGSPCAGGPQLRRRRSWPAASCSSSRRRRLPGAATRCATSSARSTATAASVRPRRRRPIS